MEGKTFAATEAQVQQADQEMDAFLAKNGLTLDDEIPDSLREQYDVLEKKASNATRRHVHAIDTATRLVQKIRDLGTPAEYNTRMHRETAKGERIGALRERTAMAKETAKDQGVPDVYLSESGNFKIGMDARYKSDLINSALGIENKGALMTFQPKDAEKRLAQRDWTGFLDRKREIIEEKAAKDAKRAEEKETRERERAEAKAKKAEEKAAAKAERDQAAQVAKEQKEHDAKRKATNKERSSGAAAAAAKAEGKVLGDPK